MAIRKIPVQYARRTTSGDFEQDMMGGNRQWIPLKLNALSYAYYLLKLMFIPAVAGLSKSDTSQSIVGAFSNMFGFCIICICNFDRYLHFYTAITVPTNKMSDDLKRSGGFIPGVRPGVETSDFLIK
jgi:preprotein translocase subunit SecY